MQLKNFLKTWVFRLFSPYKFLLPTTRWVAGKYSDQNLWHIMILAQILGAILIAIGVAPWLVPEDWLRRAIADRLVTVFGQHLITQMEITSPYVRFFPILALHADVVLFKTPEHQLLYIDDINLPLNLIGDWNSNSPITIRYAALEPIAMLTDLSTLGSSNYGFPKIRIEHISLGVVENYATYPALDVVMLPDGIMRVSLDYANDHFNIDMTRAGKAVLLTLDASIQHMGGMGGPILTKLTGVGRLADKKLEFDRINATLDQGQAHGALRLGSKDNWTVGGSLTLRKASAEAVLSWIGLPLLSGIADGTLYVSGEAVNFTDLVSIASISGQLTINNGKMFGLDLITPVRNLTIGDSRGGETPFENMRLSVERENFNDWLLTIDELRNAHISGSGLVRINGGVFLDGLIDTKDVNANPSDYSLVPLLIAGTIHEGLVRVAFGSLTKADSSITEMPAVSIDTKQRQPVGIATDTYIPPTNDIAINEPKDSNDIYDTYGTKVKPSFIESPPSFIKLFPHQVVTPAVTEHYPVSSQGSTGEPGGTLTLGTVLPVRPQ